MWTSKSEQLDRNTMRYFILRDGIKLSNADVIQLWKHNDEFNSFYRHLLSASEYAGFFWELKPVQKNSLGADFEFVLVNSSILPGIKAEQRSFAEHFKGGNVVSFPNLGGDAKLIVPECRSEEQHYAHLAAFVRNAPAEQVIDFWKMVGTEFGNAIGDSPKWLSTAGLGVYWLHVRIDSLPKYYRHEPYRKI